MTKKLTEEQQRSAHKIIVANRGDCAKESSFLSCINCPNSSYNSGVNSGVPCFTSDFPERTKSPAFQAENLRRSQAWLDEHITDADIMAESPREFCDRMVRTEGFGRCFAMITENNSLCKNCAISIDGDDCCPNECLERAKTYLASHPATPQEPPKRRPTPEEMVVGATVRVRLWNELVKEGKLNGRGHIKFPTIYFDKEMKKYCGTTHKIIKSEIICNLDGCGDWVFIPEMLDYVEPEPVAKAPTAEAKEKSESSNYELSRRDRVDWSSQIAKQFESEKELVIKSIIKGNVDKLPLGLRFINFRDLLPVDALRIIALEGQVEGLTKKLTASTKLCERLQRRLRAVL